MGFLNGRVTYVRFRVGGESPLPFGEELLETAASHAIGLHGAGEPNDGISVGWAGGDHVLDTSLDLGKNVINDALHLAIRVDTDKIPGSLLRAYTKIETDARAELNPSGYPTKTQRQEAKEAAKARAESEAADGRFRRMAHYPVLWDGQSEHPLCGGDEPRRSSAGVQTLFRETVRPHPRARSCAGSLACSMAEARGEGNRVESLRADRVHRRGRSLVRRLVRHRRGSAGFLGQRVPHLALAYPPGRRRHHPSARRLGHATVMLAKTLTLDRRPRARPAATSSPTKGRPACPRRSARVQSGKLPRKAGLIVVRHVARSTS